MGYNPAKLFNVMGTSYLAAILLQRGDDLCPMQLETSLCLEIRHMASWSLKRHCRSLQSVAPGNRFPHTDTTTFECTRDKAFNQESLACRDKPFVRRSLSKEEALQYREALYIQRDNPDITTKRFA
eukprot:3096150-Amphidinium_carterae.3